MENGLITEDLLSASGWHAESSAPKFSRLNNQEGAGAWCHASVDKNTREDYLQVIRVSFNTLFVHFSRTFSWHEI